MVARTVIDSTLVTAFFTGFAALILAMGKVLVDLRTIHKAVNSNMESAMDKIEHLNRRVAALVEITHQQRGEP